MLEVLQKQKGLLCKMLVLILYVTLGIFSGRIHNMNCRQQHCMVHHIKYAFTKLSNKMGTLEFLDITAFRMSVSCPCKGNSLSV